MPLTALSRLHDPLARTNAEIQRFFEVSSFARGRKSWLFVGSDRGGERAAMLCSLIGTARLNCVDPLAWLADVLARIADLPQSRLRELLPWEWKCGIRGEAGRYSDLIPAGIPE